MKQSKSPSLAPACLLLITLAGSVLMGGCGTREVYRDEAFSADSPFSRRIAGSSAIVCDSVKRALLGQGYALDPEAERGVLTGMKNFQRDETMVNLRLRTTCMANPDGTTMVYATAHEETTELQTLKQPAGVTIGGVVGFTVPSGSARIPITIKKETVQDPQFYARFYKQIEDSIAKPPKP